MVINPNTYSTGMPTFKGTPIEVEVADTEPVYDSITLIRRAVRGEAV
jgi:formylmethanofuran dehydrogenase subunit D